MSEETDSKYNKLHKRVKFAVGRSRNSRDDVKSETLGSKRESVKGYDKDGRSRRVKDDSAPNVDDGSSKRENTGRRVRLKTKSGHFQRGKQSYEAVFEGGQRVEPLMSGVGRSMKRQSRRVSEADDVSYGDEKLNKREYSGRSVESNTRDNRILGGKEKYKEVSYGNGELNTKSYDGKRKRIYADHNANGNGTFQKNLKTPSRKEFSGAGPSKFRDDIVEDRQTRRGASHSEQSSWKKSSVGRRKSNQDESIDERGVTNWRGSRKNINKVKGAESGDGGNAKRFDQSHKKYTTEAYEKSAKKKIQDKKSSAEDAAIRDSRPKKKRVIRIDPHDFSNKRMDDVTATMDDTKERREDSDNNKNVEMSKNAQFRAIQPSPSILSFVEEYLLGRRREIEFRRAGYNIELPVTLDNIPSSESSERARIEETVFRNKLEFFAAAKMSSSFPPPDLAEIAFAGRSNVGKSSLLNALTRQWGVARTSDKPGLTQTINFFKLGTKMSLVDLPGYGFAYAKEETKEAWEELVKEYVSTRVSLKRVCLLIDTKWGMKQRDHELIDLMERSKTKYQIILTKTDLSFPIDVARRATQIEENLAAKKSAVQPVMMISSKTGAGIRSLRTVLAKVARFVKL